MICLARMEFQKLSRRMICVLTFQSLCTYINSGDLKIHHIIQAIEISRIV